MPDLSYLKYLPYIIIGSIVIIGGIVPIFVRRFIKKTRKGINKVGPNGIPAQASVLEHVLSNLSQKIGTRRYRYVDLKLEVYHPEGESYQIDMRAPILEHYLSMYTPGKTVSVKIDPDNPNNVALASS